MLRGVSARNEAVFIGRKTQRSLRAVSAVPDITGAATPIKGPPRKRKGSVTHDLEEYEFKKTCNNDKNLSGVQLEHEKEDELVVVVVKAVHELDCMMVVKEIENGLLEEVEKLEWWFEQDIDDEGEEDEEDGIGDEV
ncbi:hypothetical protein Tco_0490801 [Tanacetum coccineum]